MSQTPPGDPPEKPNDAADPPTSGQLHKPEPVQAVPVHAPAAPGQGQGQADGAAGGPGPGRARGAAATQRREPTREQAAAASGYCPPKKGIDKGGRPRIEFDLKEVQGLAQLACTYADLASWFDCSERTIKSRMAEDPAFKQAFDRGAGKGRISLRRLQFDAAKRGDRTMLVWLGKQWLGQADKVDHTVEDVTVKHAEAREKLIRRFDRLAIAGGKTSPDSDTE